MSPVEPQHAHEHLHLRPLHDWATLIVFASFATWCWFVYNFGASLAVLREEEGTWTMVGGLHGTAFAIGGVLGALTGGIFVGRAFGAGISRAIPAELLLKISGVVGITAFGFRLFAALAPVILPARFVTGLGMSLQWPIRT